MGSLGESPTRSTRERAGRCRCSEPQLVTCWAAAKQASALCVHPTHRDAAAGIAGSFFSTWCSCFRAQTRPNASVDLGVVRYVRDASQAPGTTLQPCDGDDVRERPVESAVHAAIETRVHPDRQALASPDASWVPEPSEPRDVALPRQVTVALTPDRPATLLIHGLPTSYEAQATTLAPASQFRADRASTCPGPLARQWCRRGNSDLRPFPRPVHDGRAGPSYGPFFPPRCPAVFLAAVEPCRERSWQRRHRTPWQCELGSPSPSPTSQVE